MRFLDLLKEELDNPKRKTDNILMILFHAMKMVRVPQDYIDKVKEYVRTDILRVKDVDRFETYETKKIFSDISFYEIIYFMFNLIASGKESQFTLDHQTFKPSTLKVDYRPKEIPIEKNLMKITVKKSVPVEKMFTEGRVFNVTAKGISIKCFLLTNKGLEADQNGVFVSERELGSGEVYFGR
jgi:hypothetical protein